MAEASDIHSPLRVLRAGDYARKRWKNGAGWTSEILRVPDCDDWRLRLSIADIETDAAFSAFPGVERELVLLGGNGLRLRFEDRESHDLLPPHGRLRFAGERCAFGELIDGATRDFNLMWKRAEVDAQLWHRPLVGTMVVFVDMGDTWAIHQLAGRARITHGSSLEAMGTGDTAILASGGMRQRYVLDGSGELLLVRITPQAC